MGACSDIWDLWRNYWPVLAGNALEWYEFAVYDAWDIVIIVGRGILDKEKQNILQDSDSADLRQFLHPVTILIYFTKDSAKMVQHCHKLHPWR